MKQEIRTKEGGKLLAKIVGLIIITVLSIHPEKDIVLVVE